MKNTAYQQTCHKILRFLETLYIFIASVHFRKKIMFLGFAEIFYNILLFKFFEEP